MIKLKQLVSEGILGKFWWMDSNGNLKQVSKLTAHTGHPEAAIEILKSLGLAPEKDIYTQMYDLGWLRVAFTGQGSFYTLSFNTKFGKSPNNAQVRALKDLAIELGADEIKNNGTNHRIS
jgi:hypothetical protein